MISFRELKREILSRSSKGRLVWQCTECKKLSVWKRGWRTFGSLLQQEGGYCEAVFCSRKCADQSGLLYGDALAVPSPQSIRYDGKFYSQW